MSSEPDPRTPDATSTDATESSSSIGQESSVGQESGTGASRSTAADAERPVITSTPWGAGGLQDPQAWVQGNPNDPALGAHPESPSTPSIDSSAQPADPGAQLVESPDPIESDTVYVARPNPFTVKPRRGQPPASSASTSGGTRSWPTIPDGPAPVQDPYSRLRPSGEPGRVSYPPPPAQPSRPQLAESVVQTVLQPQATPPPTAQSPSQAPAQQPTQPPPTYPSQLGPPPAPPPAQLPHYGGAPTPYHPTSAPRRSFDQPPSYPPPYPPAQQPAGPPPQPPTQGGYGAGPHPGGPPSASSQPTAYGQAPAQPPSQPPPSQPPPQPRSYSAGELISQLNPQTDHKSRQGLRARLGLKPSTRELSELADEEMSRTAFTRPVTIMIANPKGGVGKTPTALLLAAAFGTARGGGVVAWDNNELRGTMPDRSFSPHRRTVRDLLDAQRRLAAPQSQFTDLAQFLNHQTTGKFHTLGSAQTSGHVISSDDFEQIHDILSRYFQIILVDTGNNEASPNWLAAAAAADCLVVPTKWRKDSLIPAARMLETLQEFSRDLLDRTVVVATNGPADSQEEVKRNGASWFDTTHSIIEIPTDPHVAEGGIIDWSKLGSRTRRAGLSLAAQVAARIKPLAG